MRKNAVNITVIAIFFSLLLYPSSLDAQVRYGIKAGVDYYSASSLGGKVGATAGFAVNIDLGAAGFSLQPELDYVMKSPVGAHCVNVPVNLQWGPDLILFRPFIMVSPFVGAAFRPEKTLFDYGVGVGAGIDFWRMQLQIKYSWDLGTPEKLGGLDVSLLYFF